MDANAYKVLLAAALVDGEIAAEEQAILDRVAERAGVSADDASAYAEEVKSGKLALSLPESAEEKAALFRALVDLIVADQVVDAKETSIAKRLAAHLGVDPGAVEGALKQALEEQSQVRPASAPEEPPPEASPEASPKAAPGEDAPKKSALPKVILGVIGACLLCCCGSWQGFKWKTRPFVAQVDLASTAARVKAWGGSHRGRRYPDTLEEMEIDPLDAWGNPYHYRPIKSGMYGFAELVSFGADGEPGGTGRDQDLVSPEGWPTSFTLEEHIELLNSVGNFKIHLPGDKPRVFTGDMVRDDAIEKIVAEGDAAVPFLKALIDSNAGSYIREGAAEALNRIQAKER